MKYLIPHESDNWDEFDLRAAIAKHLAGKGVSAEDALWAILWGLANDHRDNRLSYPGEMPPTLLQGVELLLQQQAQKNHETYDDEAGEDAPQDSEFIAGMVAGQIAHGQSAVCELLCDCMKAVGCAPIRKAA
jgi:hypothetical protein